MFPMARPAHARNPDSRLPVIVLSVAAALVAIGAVVWVFSHGVLASASNAAPPPTSPSPSATASAPVPADPSPAPSPEAPPPPANVEFTLVTGGDVLTHMPVVRSARAAGDGEYEFEALMRGVQPYIEDADLAICHLEVPVTPPGTSPSGYPMFAGPPELVTALANTGWDGCSTASNHSVDKRFAGIEATLGALDDAGLGHSGMARTQDEAASVQMYTVRTGQREIQVANISFTYGLNGLPKPDGMPWAVDTFNAETRDVTPIVDAAQRARDQGADIVIASTHCCIEYQIQPNAAQRDIVEQIAQSGLVDLYVGHHAHVPQPIELLDGGVHGEGMWAYFGHGNFLSNQDAHCCVPITNSGYLGVTTFTVTPAGHVSVEPAWVATTVDRTNGHTMHALVDILESGAGNLSAAEAQARHTRVADAVGDQAPELTTAPRALAHEAFPVPRSTSAQAAPAD